MELLPFFLFCASFFCVPLSQVKAASKNGPIFDASPPRDRPNQKPSLTDLLSSIGQNKKGAANAWHLPERAAETASAEAANVTSSSSTQADSSHSRRQTVDITKSRRTRRPSIAENEPITKQLNDLAIQEQSLNAAAADMSSESLHIKPQASGQTIYQNPNLQLIGQPNYQNPNPQLIGQTNYQNPNPQLIGQTNYQNPNPQLIAQTNYQIPINPQPIGQTKLTHNLPTEVLSLDMLSLGDTTQNQAQQMAIAPANLANSTETVRPNDKTTTSKPRKKKNSHDPFADNAGNQMPTQYPKVPISKWTNHRLPVHPKELRAKGQFDVKKKFPAETNGLDKIAEFMDDTGEWVKIEVKQGKAVVIYLRDLFGNLPQIEEPKDLTFGGKKRFLRTNGTEILYPAEIIYSWTKYQLPVHAEHLVAVGGQFDVKEKYPTETNGLDKIAEFMDDTGEWVRIEVKQGKSGSKYVRDLFGNPPQIDGPIKLMFGETSQFVSIDGMLMSEENYEKVKKNNQETEKNRKQAEKYLEKLEREEAAKERRNRMVNLNWATNTFPNWNSQMPNANPFIPNNTFPAAGAFQHNPPQWFGNYAMAPPIGDLPFQGATVFNTPQTIHQTFPAGALGTNQQFLQRPLPPEGLGTNQQFSQPTNQAMANYPFMLSASVPLPQTQTFPLPNALPFAMNSNGGSLTYPTQMNYAQMPAPAQNTHSEQVPKKKKNTSKKQTK